MFYYINITIYIFFFLHFSLIVVITYTKIILIVANISFNICSKKSNLFSHFISTDISQEQLGIKYSLNCSLKAEMYI